MKKLIILIGGLIMIASCNWHNIPKIKLEVEKVKRIENWHESPVFEISLTSNENILHYYYSTKAVNLYLFCPLFSQDFSAKNISEEPYIAETHYINSLLQESEVIFQKGIYHYKMPMRFVKRNINNVSEQLLNEQEIKEVISEKNCTLCKMVLAYMHKPIYKSETFCIPVDSVLVYLK